MNDTFKLPDGSMIIGKLAISYVGAPYRLRPSKQWGLAIDWANGKKDVYYFKTKKAAWETQRKLVEWLESPNVGCLEFTTDETFYGNVRSTLIEIGKIEELRKRWGFYVQFGHEPTKRLHHEFDTINEAIRDRNALRRFVSEKMSGEQSPRPGGSGNGSPE